MIKKNSKKKKKMITTNLYKNLEKETCNINFNDELTQMHFFQYEKFLQKRMLERIEASLIRSLNAGVRKCIKNKIVAIEEWRIVEILFKQAKRVSNTTRKVFYDEKIHEETIKHAYFEKNNLPQLKSKSWGVKEYSCEEHDWDHDIHIKDTFRVRVQTLSFSYNPVTCILEANMSWETEKLVELGKFVYWSGSN